MGNFRSSLGFGAELICRPRVPGKNQVLDDAISTGKHFNPSNYLLSQN